jgi:hypothetical protein
LTGISIITLPTVFSSESCRDPSGAQITLEFLGVTAFLPYALLLTRGMYPTGSPGLPAASEDPGVGEAAAVVPPSEQTPENGWYHVRVLIPCYKEPLEVVSGTVQHALDAALPAHVRRCAH